MFDPEATWHLGEFSSRGKTYQVLNIFYATATLETALRLCQIATNTAIAYGMEHGVQMSVHPNMAHIAFHLYEPGDLKNDHFAAAWEVSEAIAAFSIRSRGQA